MGTVINLAAVRAARQAADDPTCDDLADLAPHQLTAHMRGHARRAPPPASPLTAAPKPARASASPPPLHWQESQRGNWWTQDTRGLHLVLYETRRGWSARATLNDQSWYVNDVPADVDSAEEARAWAEEWLGMRCVPSAAAT